MPSPEPLRPSRRAARVCDLHLSWTGVGAWDDTRTVALRPPCGLLKPTSLLASDDFQGPGGLKHKRKLSPGPDASGRKPDPVTSARHTYGPAPPAQGRASPGQSEHRSRNYYRVPFRHCLPHFTCTLSSLFGNDGASTAGG